MEKSRRSSIRTALYIKGGSDTRNILQDQGSPKSKKKHEKMAVQYPDILFWAYIQKTSTFNNNSKNYLGRLSRVQTFPKYGKLTGSLFTPNILLIE